MSRQIFLVVLALVIGYAAIYFGDGLYHYSFGAFKAATTPDEKTAAAFVCLIPVFFAIFGFFVWGTVFPEQISSWQKTIELENIVGASAAFVLFSVSFGAVSAPFTYYGPYPWYWMTKWVVLILLALVPLAIAIHAIVQGLIADRQNKK